MNINPNPVDDQVESEAEEDARDRHEWARAEYEAGCLEDDE